MRAACILGRRDLDVSRSLAQIMLNAIHRVRSVVVVTGRGHKCPVLTTHSRRRPLQVLSTVRFDYLAFIEFVDESDTGLFTPDPSDWGAPWFVDDVRDAAGLGGPARVRVVSAATGGECRDLLEFTDEEHASYVDLVAFSGTACAVALTVVADVACAFLVLLLLCRFVCGTILPVDGFALPGNTRDFDTAESCVGNCTDLRILQSYVHNYHVLDMQRYTSVKASRVGGV